MILCNVSDKLGAKGASLAKDEDQQVECERFVIIGLDQLNDKMQWISDEVPSLKSGWSP